MPILFNSLLDESNLSPTDVILLRHQDTRAATDRTPYELWRDDPRAFELYQSFQKIRDKAKFSRAAYWASFVATPYGETMFVGLYGVRYKERLARDTPQPHTNEIDAAGSCDVYELQPDERLADMKGKLFIDWGSGTRAWVQRAEKGDKHVIELRPKFKEDDFPGYMNFVAPLSEISKLPPAWIDRFREAAGVYVFTCPRTNEQYIGSATGDEGFFSAG